MAETVAGLLEHYRGQRSELLEALAGLSDDELREPSLDGWSVKDHLAHLAAWDELRAAEVTRISAGFESAWRVEGDDDVYGQLIYTLRRGLSVEQVRWELAQTYQRLIDAIESATERGLDESLYGEAALRSTHEAQHTGWIRRWRSDRGR